MAETRLGAAILAAGQSRRFGGTDKLTARLHGRMLGEHVVRTLGGHGLGMASVICSSDAHPCAPVWRECGFDVAVNLDAERGMGTSVAIAARLAMEARCDKLLIALADMPMVPAAFYRALVRSADGPDCIVTSANGDIRMPPAVFGSDHFPALAQLHGDKGARDLLAQGETYPCPPEWLVDIDTPETLAALEAGIRSPS